MCGIIGCTARDTPVVGALLEGLKRLEYRGYDSAGIAVLGAVRELHGSFAISAMHRGHPGVVIGARKDSPLIVALGDGKNFLASDVAAVLEHTKRVIFLEEGDVAMLTPTDVEIVDFDG